MSQFNMPKALVSFLASILMLPSAFALDSKAPLPEARTPRSEPGSAAAHITPVSLKECVERALAISEDLLSDKARLMQARERYRQAVSALFPTLSLSTAHQQRSPSNYGVLNSSGSDPSADPAGRRSQGLGSSLFESAFIVRQPIFRGFREFLLADAATAEEESLSAIELRNRELLYQEVAQTYHQARFHRDDLAIIARTKASLEERIRELTSFAALGRTRESEVVAAKADLAATAVIKERAKGLEQAALEYLAFLTRTPAKSLSLLDEPPQFEAPPLDTLLQKAQNRADTLAARAAHRSAVLKAKSIRRELWPEASLEAGGFIADDPDRNRDWQVLLRLDIPILTFGRVDARATEAELEARIAELTHERIKRTVELEVRDALTEFESVRREHGALDTLVHLRKKNYNLQRSDYTLGVVTNLEVLESLRQLYESERQLREARARLAYASVSLAVATGGALP